MANPARVTMDCSTREIGRDLLSNAEAADLAAYQSREASRIQAEEQRTQQMAQAKARVAADPNLRDVAIALGLDVPAGP